MRVHTLSSLLLAGWLGLVPFASLAEDTTAPAASALPPGVNPASPAGGNGGDADGLEKKSATPAPPGSVKKSSAAETDKKSPTGKQRKPVHKKQ
ncbi:hypothetical protein ACIPL1_18205 [Pseudomonas sp. NPDC090202]|uniref:hypothetical protein n=1 Tax=unclassified Pseudomonas TaxID=196821 RepID=UPI003817BB97